MPSSVDFIKAFAKKCLLGTSMPWQESSWLISLVEEGSIRSGMTLDQLTLVMDSKAATSWDVVSFQEESEDPAILPKAVLTDPPEWVNEESSPVIFRSVVVTGYNTETEKDDILFWAVLGEAESEGYIEVEALGSYFLPADFGFEIHELTEQTEEKADLVFETSNHVSSALMGPSTTIPSIIHWQDIHIIDPTLGEDFKLAAEKLEGLLYAIFGSRPKTYSPYVEWYKRENPRCNWMPEQKVEDWDGSMQDDDPVCTSMVLRYWETAAYGENGPRDGSETSCPKPHVPIRSVSGDWRTQIIDDSRTHDRTVFPVLTSAGEFTVARDDGSQLDYNDRQTFDPKGDGDFGGDPTLIGSDGDYHIDGEDVTIYYTPPESIAELIDSVHLYYDKGATGTFTEVAMALNSDGTYEGEIPTDDHNTVCHWYVRVKYTPEGESQITKFDPGVDSAPGSDSLASVEAYTFTFFSHYNPFPFGLPEVLSICKKGTDEYKFTGDEEIQFEMINLFRFVLDYLGSIFHYHPDRRPEGIGCCRNFPIQFVWSGSAPYPHYRRAGKTSDGKPIHILDKGVENWTEVFTATVSDTPGGHVGNLIYLDAEIEEITGAISSGCKIIAPNGSTATVKEVYGISLSYTDADSDFPVAPDLQGETVSFECPSYDSGSVAARRSWRGVGDFKWDDNISPSYGQGRSWETIPLYLYTESDHRISEGEKKCRNLYTGYQAGLQEGDIIDAVHLREIITAIEFLIENGAWMKVPIKTRVSTPHISVRERGCNEFYSYDPILDSTNNWNTNCTGASGKCNVPTLDSDGFTYVCADYIKPDFEDCWSDDTPEGVPPIGRCYIEDTHHTCRVYDWVSGAWVLTDLSGYPPCSTGDTDSLECYESFPGVYLGGDVSSYDGPNELDPGDWPDSFKMCSNKQYGWAGFVCGPRSCLSGIDSTHGNSLRKLRSSGASYPADLLYDPASWGNCFGESYTCGLLLDEDGEPTDSHDLPFDSVSNVLMYGRVDPWIEYCGVDVEIGGFVSCLDALNVPDITGYVDNLPIDYDGETDGENAPLCTSQCYPTEEDSELYWRTRITCSLNEQACNDETEVWASINLNVDGRGIPTLVEYEEEPLDDFDSYCDGLTSSQNWNRLAWCPCETETGPSSCNGDYCSHSL